MKQVFTLISILAIGALGTSVLAQSSLPSTASSTLPHNLDELIGSEQANKLRDAEIQTQKEIEEAEQMLREAKDISENRILNQVEEIRKAKERMSYQIAAPELTLNHRDLKPGMGIYITASTYSFNLGESHIVWYHNNKRVKSGYGNTSYYFTLGELGTAENIRAIITAPNGKAYEMSKTVRPARIYITWGANAYAPAWYRGKALPAPGSTITITAVPDFRIGNTVISSQDIVYEWLINNAPQPISSGVNGRGKNVFSFDTGVSANVEYKVVVRARDVRNRITTEEAFSIRAYPTDLVFYERDPSLGLKYWHAIKNTPATSGKDLVLQFEPFNISNRYIDKLFYTWRVNNKKIANQSPQSRVFRLLSEAGSSGTQNIDVSYELPKNIFVRGSGHVIVRIQ